MEREIAHRIPIATAAVVLATILFGGPMYNLVEATSGPNLVEPNGSISVSSRLVFQNPRGLHDYYAFFYAPAGSIWSYRLSNDGVAWSSGVGVITGSLGSASLWVYDTGSQLVVHLVASGTAYGSIMYRRGTISDSSQAIAWGSVQTVEPGGTNAGTFGLTITRTAGGRPVITAVREVFTNQAFRYEVSAWGANQDTATPTWTRTMLIPSSSALSQQIANGFTSVYPAGLDYVFAVASFARASMTGPWDEGWVRALWTGSVWSVGIVSVLASGESRPRPPSLVVDESFFPHALVMPTEVGSPGGLVHFQGKSQDGTAFEKFSLSLGTLTSATLSIDQTSTPKRLMAIYHYDTPVDPRDPHSANGIYWREGPTDTMNWGPENFMYWQNFPKYLSSSQRDLVGHVHALAYTLDGVYYFNI